MKPTDGVFVSHRRVFWYAYDSCGDTGWSRATMMGLTRDRAVAKVLKRRATVAARAWRPVD